MPPLNNGLIVPWVNPLGLPKSGANFLRPLSSANRLPERPTWQFTVSTLKNVYVYIYMIIVCIYNICVEFQLGSSSQISLKIVAEISGDEFAVRKQHVSVELDLCSIMKGICIMMYAIQ